MGCRGCAHLSVLERNNKYSGAVTKCKVKHSMIGFFRWLIGCKGKEAK